MLFEDRSEAGRALAGRLLDLNASRPVVLALPRGGVPIGYEIARVLAAPLDLVLVRKIGVPFQPELALGAVAEGEDQEFVIDTELCALLGITDAEVAGLRGHAIQEMQRRRRAYLAGRAQVDIAGRTAIVVDDGIATGATIQVALRAVRRRGPARLILAVPVAPPDTIAKLRAEADETVCLATPTHFHSVGQFYRHFPQLQDEEVVALMDEARAWGGDLADPPGDAANHAVVAAVRAALRRMPRIRTTGGPLHILHADGDLTLDGEVDHIAGKKLALAAAAGVASVTRIIDRLRVKPATRMVDGEIRVALRNALLEEFVLGDCTLREQVKGRVETVREPAGATGVIEVRVADGVVTLDGDVAGLGQKRLAGVLAWWVPGTRDVVNGLGITPPEADSAAAVTDAVRQVLEKDPLVCAETIDVNTRRGIVYLDGMVPREAERKLAEDDTWYVFGVDGVVNRLTVP